MIVFLCQIIIYQTLVSMSNIVNVFAVRFALSYL